MTNRTHDAILQNARRLLRDAQHLAGQRSFRTAIALAVLSIEESGKACAVRWLETGSMRKNEADALLRGHIGKQQVFAAYRVFKAISSVGSIVRQEEVPDQVLASIDRDQLIEDMAEAISKNHVHIRASELGLLDHLKQTGFYTDLESDFDPSSQAAEFSEGWFDLVREYAEEAMEMAGESDETQRIVSVLYNSNAVGIADDKKRKAELKNWIVGIQEALVAKD